MSRAQTPSAWVVAALTAGLVACADSMGGQTGDEDGLPEPSDFYADLARRQGAGNYMPAASVAELVSWSDRVVVGSPIAMRPGRVFVADSAGGESRLPTVVLEVRADRNLLGPDDSALYLEFWVGAAEAGAPERIPDARALVFAEEASSGSIFQDGSVEQAGAGLPSGATLYRLTTPQGFALQGDGTFSQPFEPMDQSLGGGDLDGLIERVERAVSASGAGPDAGPDAGVDGGSASCPGEASSCPAVNCYEMRAYVIDETRMCVDYASGTVVVGCTPDEAGTDDAPCVERISDGSRFVATQGSPFRGSEAWRECTDPPAWADCAD